MTRTVYVGLLTDKYLEPLASTGYARCEVNLNEEHDISQIPFTHTIMFNTVENSDYGNVTHIVAYDSPTSEEPVQRWELPEPVNVWVGITPFINNGNLYKGICMKIQSTTGSDSNCGVN